MTGGRESSCAVDLLPAIMVRVGRGRVQGNPSARRAGVLAVALAVSSCGGSGSGWDEKAAVTGNACPPVKRLVTKAEVEKALGGRPDEGERSGYPLMLDLPTCVFSARAERGPATLAVVLADGLGSDLIAQFREERRNEQPVVVAGLGDEALWYEGPRMMLVRKGSSLLALQMSLTGPRFSFYRNRSTDLARKMVDRL